MKYNNEIGIECGAVLLKGSGLVITKSFQGKYVLSDNVLSENKPINCCPICSQDLNETENVISKSKCHFINEKRRFIVKTEFLNKLNDWYGSYLERYEIINETENDVLLFTAYRDILKVLKYEIVRIFTVGDSVQISVDESVGETNMDSILKLIQAVVRVI
jgi:hypothetical protein